MQRKIYAITAAVMGVAGFAQAQSFSIVALPDTQNYSQALPYNPAGSPPIIDPSGTEHIFGDQVDWVLNNAAAKNIQYVVHLGDMTDHGVNTTEWSRVRTAMDKLDVAGMPYGTCMGNHDNHGFGTLHTESNISPANYLANYDPSRFAGKDWFGGVSPSGKSNYQTISAGGKDFLMLNLSIDTPQAEVDWAQTVLDANKDKLTIVSTHRYLYDFRLIQGRYGDGQVGTDTYDETGLASERYEVSAVNPVWPEELWNGFIKNNRSVFMVLAGHCHGQYERVSTNSFGLPVLEVLTDYQDGANGGNGFLRVMDFDTANNRISFQTYSPTAPNFTGGTGRFRSVMADDYLETVKMVDAYGPSLWAGLPADQKAYYALQGITTFEEFKSVLKQDVPYMDLANHPEWMALVATLQAMSPGITIEQINEQYKMEGLWMMAFAPDPNNPLTAFAGNGPRDPQFTIDLSDYTDAGGQTVTFQSYVPEPTSLTILGLATAALVLRRRHGERA